MNENTPKIAVIGWDSASFQIIAPLLEAGVLPNLQRLMERGAWGPLTSTLHPLSPTAWASFMTGMNPGKHGIFDFVSLNRDGTFRVANGGAVQTQTLWGRLSRAGRRVAVVNVPMTYPPEAVNGALIAGMDAPRIDRAFTHPPQLAARLAEQFGVYRVGVAARGRPWESVAAFTERYVSALVQSVRQRGDVTCHLLQTHPVDFLTAVFTAPDRVQHALGHLMTRPISPGDGIGRVYRACDDALGRILNCLGDDRLVVVMSDHGACAYRRTFELGTWLRQEGWLTMRPAPPATPLVERLAPLKRRLNRLTGRIAQEKPRLEQFLNRIVWPETKAFALGAFGSIFINTRLRFAGGAVEPDSPEYESICRRISEQLLAVEDPETGDPIVRAVHRASAVYHGPCASLAPDLLVETHPDYFVRNNLDHQEGRVTYPAGRYAGRSLAHTGRHTPEGMVVAAGFPFVAGQKPPGAAIIDLAPTILHLGGLPVPAAMDGQPLVGWLDERYRQTHPVTRVDSKPADPGGKTPAYSEQEAAAVQARLQDLGYLD